MNKMKLKEFKMDKEDHKIYRTEECCDNKLRINQILCDSEGEYTEQISVISTNAFEMIKECTALYACMINEVD